MMKNIVFVLDKGETEHKEYSGWAAQRLLPLFRSE